MRERERERERGRKGEGEVAGKRQIANERWLESARVY